VTRWVCENIDQNAARSISCQNSHITLTEGKSSPKMLASSVIFKNCPKITIAKSGQPTEWAEHVGECWGHYFGWN
jgi:hypothetical protein